MSENVSWSLLFTAFTAIFSFIAAITEIYYRVYIPKTKEKERKREEIYKPLLKDVESLIESVRMKEKFSPPFNWKTVEEKVSSKLFERLKELFEEKASNYYELLQYTQDFIRFKGYFYLNTNLSKLQGEFHSLGVGALEYELYQAIVIPILEGDKISLRWLEDNRPELFENLKKCPTCKDLKRLLDWLSEEPPCVGALKKTEQELLQSAEKLRTELRKF